MDKGILSNKFKMKKYLHIDKRVKFEKVKSYVTNCERIKTHSFLPFIHYVHTMEKFTGEPNYELENRPIKEKNRNIMYAGHLDNYIYKYYSLILNEAYNKWMQEHGLDTCSTAYRDNKKHQSNINFSAEVINKVAESERAYILVGDFTNFFDEISHKILKRNMMRILNVTRLEADWYNVFRSLTKFGYYDKEKMNGLFGTDDYLRNIGKFSYFDSVKEFHKHQKNMKPQYNNKLRGIPQGTAISGVLANVYAINFDRKMNEIAMQCGGLYRRYSDDFIIIVPGKVGKSHFDRIDQSVQDLAKANNIGLQEKKTGRYEYNNDSVYDLDTKKVSHLDYLGFLFDGQRVKIRGKGPYKFYRNASILIDKAKRTKYKKGLKKLPYRKRIYRLYTDMGAKGKPFGNFITYAQNAQKVFDEISPSTDNCMLQQIKNRKKKIEKKMGVRLHMKV